MNPADPLNDAATFYLTNGVLGVSCLVMGLVIIKLWNEVKAERAAAKLEVAAKQALIEKLYEERIKENNVVKDLSRSTESTLAAVLNAIGASKGQQK